MKTNWLILLLLTFCLALPSGAWAEWSANLNTVLGFKVLNTPDWTPVHKGGEIGFLTDFKKASWPLSIAIDGIYSKGQTLIWTRTGFQAAPGMGLADIEPMTFNRFRSETYELNLGIRKNWTFNHIRLFAGTGIAATKAAGRIININETGGASYKTQGEGWGGWLGTGFYLVFNKAFNLGLDIRYSKIDVPINDDITVNGGGFHFRMVLGYPL